MKIKFKKKRIIYNLIFSVFYTVIGLEGIINQRNIRWTKPIFLIIGIIYLITTVFEIITQYIVIENGTLRKYRLLAFHKDIELQNIIQIKTFAGDYILVTQTTELKIQVEHIADDSLEELKRILSELDLPSDKTPFPKENNVIQPPQL